MATATFRTFHRSRAGAILLAAILTAALNFLSFFVAQHVTRLETFWPTIGALLAFCLIVPEREREIVLGFFLGCLATSIANRLELGLNLSMPVVCTAELWAALLLSHRVVGRPVDFRNWRSLLAFLAVVTLVSASVGALAAYVFAAFRHVAFLPQWFGWSISGLLSFALYTPLLVLTLGPRRNATAWQADLRTRMLCIAASVAIVAITYAQAMIPIPYVIPGVLIITSLVADVETVAAAFFLIANLVIVTTALGAGPLASTASSPAMRMIDMQVGLAVLSFVLLPAAAAITESRTLRNDLERALATAEKAMNELNGSQQRFRLLAEMAPDIVMRTSFDGRIEYISPAVKRITGYRPEDLMGRIIWTLIEPDDVPGLIGVLSATIADRTGSRAHAVEFRARHRDGHEIWFEARARVQRDKNGKFVSMFDIVRDVTEHKNMERALVEARDRAEAAAEAKSEFLANMSHELRTPLTAVLGFADLLNKNPSLDGRGRTFVGRIHAAGHALLATVNDVLDYARLERGQLDLASEPTSPAEQAAEAIRLLSVQADLKRLRLVLDIEPSLREEEFLLDPHRLRQVLVNLVGNAVKFTERGSVTLSMRTTIDRTRLRCAVRDTGAGIPIDRLGKLFQRFSQVDASTTRRHRGTGLGLAISKAIVERMEGLIGVESELGTGSCFWFEIPVVPIGRAEPVTALAPPRLADLSRARVLIVDDTELNRTLVRAALEPLNIPLDDAANGEAAILRAHAERYDLILMDLQMPDLDGVAAMRGIRGGEGLSANAVILAFTAEGDSGRLANLASMGFSGVLQKPLDLARLRNSVAEALAVAEREDRSEALHVA